MDITATIRRGWEITWNNKFLWVLGFLAALGSGNSFAQYSADSSDFQGLSPEQVSAISAGLVVLICVGLILGILMALVSLAARGGLVAAAAGIDRGETYTFGQAFRAGWNKLWSLIGMSLLLFGVVIIGGIVFIVLLVASGGSVAALLSMGDSVGTGSAIAGVSLLVLCLISLCCLLIPVSIALNFIHAFAFRGIMLRDLGAVESIRHGWQVVRENFANILMLALAFLVLNAIVGLIAAAILVPFSLLVAAPIVLLGNTDATVLQGILAVGGILVVVVISALIGAVVAAWQSSTFTLAYQTFTGKSSNLGDVYTQDPPIV